MTIMSMTDDKEFGCPNCSSIERTEVSFPTSERESYQCCNCKTLYTIYQFNADEDLNIDGINNMPGTATIV